MKIDLKKIESKRTRQNFKKIWTLNQKAETHNHCLKPNLIVKSKATIATKKTRTLDLGSKKNI